MWERIIVTADDGRQRIVRVPAIAELWMELRAARWSLVVSLLRAGDHVVVVAGMRPTEARDLFKALKDWISVRGGVCFDIDQWRKDRRERSKNGSIWLAGPALA